MSLCESWLAPALGVFALGVCLQLARKSLFTSNPTLPPGPKGLPLIGNLLDMPTKATWKTFSEWGRKYGGVVSLQLMGQVIVVVNKLSLLEELEKHGSRFSSRPHMPMAGELCGYSRALILAPYSPSWKNQRRMIAKVIGSTAANEKHAEMELLETARFLSRVLTRPDDLESQIRRTAGAIILKLTYGIEVQDGEDPLVKLIRVVNDNLTVATQPGAWLVDVAPGLMNALPESLLIGGGFKAVASKFSKCFNDMVEVPFAETQSQIENHIAPPSFVSNLLEEKPEMGGEELFDLKHAAASLYAGGADTTTSTQHAFFLAMVLFPEVQLRAQEEIDRVIGRDRLIKLSDRANLPYVAAVVSESLRWNSVVPAGFPHLATEPGVIGGYYVPEGAIIFSNLWQMLHDEELYPDPFTFNPDRHIAKPGKPAQKDPRFACFGWGRRVCPGMHLADATVFLMIANALAVLQISKAVDENGVEVTPVHEYTTGLISHLKPFKCSIRSRHGKASELIAEGCLP
ncbi:cytochrome P450 [Flagelloscypha sp. PMI_526]|nr:cytochrome P450 [Flagelloscypha sp. PMI_526]